MTQFACDVILACKRFPAHPGTEGPHAVTWTGIELDRLCLVPQTVAQFLIKPYI